MPLVELRPQRQAVIACLRPQRPCEVNETCVKLRPFSPVVELLDAFDKPRAVVGYMLMTTNGAEEGRSHGLNFFAPCLAASSSLSGL